MSPPPEVLTPEPATPQPATSWDPRSAEFIRDRVVVPEGEEARGAEFAAAVVEAQAVVDAFAQANGWQTHVVEPLYGGFEIYSTQQALLERILELNSLPLDTPVPTTGLAGGVEGNILVVLTPEACQELRPEYYSRPDSWMRLLAHELVHRLHVRLLQGDEDAMGPRWFYEGFAVFGSQQGLGGETTFPTPASALESTRAKGRDSYTRYEGAVRYFADEVGLKDMVRNAGAPDFEDRLEAEFTARKALVPE